MTGVCMMGAMREDRAPVKWNKRFIYPKSQRSLIQGKRHYAIKSNTHSLVKQKLLPSVTTIISARRHSMTIQKDSQASLLKTLLA